MIAQPLDTLTAQSEWLQATFEVEPIAMECGGGSVLTYIPSVYRWEVTGFKGSIWRPHPLLAFGTTKKDSLSNVFDVAVAEVAEKNGHEVFSIFRPRKGQDIAMIGAGRAHEVIYNKDPRHNHDERDRRVFDFEDINISPDTMQRLPTVFETSHCHIFIPGH